MEIPRLYSLINPDSPQWGVPKLNESEVDLFYESIIAFVGYDPTYGADHECVVLGSGVLVGIDETLIVISAAHIFPWWINRVMPSSTSVLSDAQSEIENIKKRGQKVVENGYIKAFVKPRKPHEGRICSIVGMSFNPYPKYGDIAVIQLDIPSGIPLDDFRILLIDSDPFPLNEPVLIAGFIGGGRSLTIEEEPFSRGLYELDLVVRAGYVGEIVNKNHGYQNSMYRVNIPSEPGMSGGPMIILRSGQNLLEPSVVCTTAGIISKSGTEIPFLLNHNADGETWVCPIVYALARRVYRDGELHFFYKELKHRPIPSYGKTQSIIWETDPVTGQMTPKTDDSL